MNDTGSDQASNAGDSCEARQRDQPISALTLGTVQFGLPYGIANTTGQVTSREVVRIVAAALEHGVHCFDTAAAYGESEEALGRAFRELKCQDDVFVVTKTPPIKHAAQAAQEIRSSIAESRRRLGIDCLSAVLFHREEDAVHLDELRRLRDDGWLCHLGVSCSNQPPAALELARTGAADVLQAPANLLDRRHLESGLLDAARENQVAIFIRSVFLQGLLVMPESQVRADLADCLKPRRDLQDLADQAAISLRELALRFIHSLPGVSSVVVGVDSLEQFSTNVEVFARGPLENDLLGQLLKLSWNISERTITPHMWEDSDHWSKEEGDRG